MWFRLKRKGSVAMPVTCYLAFSKDARPSVTCYVAFIDLKTYKFTLTLVFRGVHVDAAQERQNHHQHFTFTNTHRNNSDRVGMHPYTGPRLRLQLSQAVQQIEEWLEWRARKRSYCSLRKWLTVTWMQCYNHPGWSRISNIIGLHPACSLLFS